MKNIYLTLFIIFLGMSFGYAQLPASIVNFNLLDVGSNKKIALANFSSQKAVVLIFTSHYCPYSKLYEKRILNLAKAFENQGVTFLLINSNTSVDNEDDSVEEMTKWVNEKKMGLPYLADKDRQVANALGALRNPEVFVLQAANGIFVVKYRGAIDNNPQIAEAATEFYLQEVVSAILNRKNIPFTEKKPTGCVIKKE